MKLTRKQVINTLNTLKLEWGELAPPEDNICDALDYAIDTMSRGCDFMRDIEYCATCKKAISDDEPYVVAHKNGVSVCFCKEHVENARRFIDWYMESVPLNTVGEETKNEYREYVWRYKDYSLNIDFSTQLKGKE